MCALMQRICQRLTLTGLNNLEQYTLFYLIGIYIAFAAGLWSVAMGYFGRSKDPFSCLTIMRIPYVVMFFICMVFGLYTLSDVQNLVYNHWPLITFGAGCSIIAVSLRMYASKHMPVGTVTTIAAVCFILGVLGYEFLFMNTFPTLVQFIVISGIIAGTVILVSLRNHTSLDFLHLPIKALSAATFCGLSNGVAFVSMGDIAREANPFATAIIYNLFIGILVLFALVYRKKFHDIGFDEFDLKSFLGVCGTACIGMTVAFGFAYGSTLGSVTVLAGLESSSIVVAALLSWLLLKEKLSIKQWAAISFVTVCIIALKFLG